MYNDYHIHTTYSDGSFAWQMVRAAEEAGLDGVGLGDHCSVSRQDELVQRKKVNGFNLDEMYERRREGIRRLRDRFDIRIFDAVEMDYHPSEEPVIEDFLDAAGFQYTIGSVHQLPVDGEYIHVMNPRPFQDFSETERRDVVSRYVDRVVSLIDSGLFDIAAHVDVMERNPELRGLSTEEDYRRIVDALRRSDTVPEVNAGRALTGYGEVHPHPDLLELLVQEDVQFTAASDAHTPDELRDRNRYLEEFFDERGIEPLDLDL